MPTPGDVGILTYNTVDYLRQMLMSTQTVTAVSVSAVLPDGSFDLYMTVAGNMMPETADVDNPQNCDTERSTQSPVVTIVTVTPP